jgi:hypothetical protein
MTVEDDDSEYVPVTYLCACCGEGKITHSYICGVCGWEKDFLQESDPDDDQDPNDMSLNQARKIWKETGKPVYPLYVEGSEESE